MRKLLILTIVLLGMLPSAAFAQNPVKWTFVGYRVQEKVPGCNPRMARYGYAWVCDQQTRDQFIAAAKEKNADTYVESFHHFNWSGNVIALVENTISCSSNKSTHLSYKFYSAKDLASLNTQLEKVKSYTPDIKSYRIVKTIDYKEETDKIRLTGQCAVIGEIN
ncbi:hypothetical protein [Rufibacter psychrotolerans]|uniref:hypothetical protein n=1 Tax=Rufibacter psychrotolerans TaxID=2812556 RepID=UPI001967A0A8|nr:hypothetical protein [Rufibacter sp. SYSU D00308]